VDGREEKDSNIRFVSYLSRYNFPDFYCAGMGSYKISKYTFVNAFILQRKIASERYFLKLTSPF
jgi:hypothetical protein